MKSEIVVRLRGYMSAGCVSPITHRDCAYFADYADAFGLVSDQHVEALRMAGEGNNKATIARHFEKTPSAVDKWLRHAIYRCVMSQKGVNINPRVILENKGDALKRRVEMECKDIEATKERVRLKAQARIDNLEAKLIEARKAIEP